MPILFIVILCSVLLLVTVTEQFFDPVKSSESVRWALIIAGLICLAVGAMVSHYQLTIFPLTAGVLLLALGFFILSEVSQT